MTRPRPSDNAVTIELSRRLHMMAALVTVGLTVLLGAALWFAFVQAVETRGDRAEMAIRMVEREITRTLEAVEMTMVAIAAEAEPALNGQGGLTQGGGAKIRARLSQAIGFAPHIRQMAVVSQGTVLVDTNNGEGASLDMKRMGLSAGSAAAFNLGISIGRSIDSRFLPELGGGSLPGPGLIVLAVPIDREHEILLIVALNAVYFQNLFNDIGLDERGGFALARLDGEILVGSNAILIDRQVLQDLAHADRLDARELKRLLGWPKEEEMARLSTRYPVGIALTLSHGDTLAEWGRRNVAVLLVLAGCAALVLAGTLLLVRDTLRRVALERQVRLLYRAVEQSPVVVVITDADGDFTYVNPAFTALYGYAAHEVIGKNPRIIRSTRTPPATHLALWESLRSGQPWTGEFFNRAKDGSIRCVSATVSVIQGGAGERPHYVGVMADMDEIKRIQQERESLLARLTRAHEDLHRFSEISAHHLQEPARRMVSFARRLKDSLGERLSGEDRISLDFIDQQAARLRNLLRDVQLYLAADVIPPGQPSADVGMVLGKAVRQFSDEVTAIGGTLEMRSDPEIAAHAAIEPARLEDVIHILLSNAIQYRRADVPLGIVVSVEAGITDEAEEMVLLSIADNGIGIPVEHRERAFRVFERLGGGHDPQRTGIGLAIVRRIAECRGGRIWIEDGMDGGTAIKVELPTARQQRGA